MNLYRAIGLFTLTLAVVLGVSYTIHDAVLTSSASDNLVLLPGYYLMNAVFGLCIGVLIIYLSQDRPDTTGFTFMGGSLLKLVIFFIFFFPELSDQETVQKSQFLTFFIPYALTMIVEVWYLIRFLNKQS
ncbi:MAG: hypothetical protein HQ500_04525 [Flavobacteriales bacterium]|nr:hypothetical protein [Flavobacteriales bacterium]